MYCQGWKHAKLRITRLMSYPFPRRFRVHPGISLLCLLVVCGWGPCAYAQSHGYGFGGVTLGEQAPGDGALRLGLGGNWRVLPHVTVGGEAGTIQKDGTGAILSATAGVHLRQRVETGADPFFAAGITGARLRGETGVYGNFGGGINYWFRPRIAFRAEFRGYAGGSDLNSFSEFRFGISFR